MKDIFKFVAWWWKDLEPHFKILLVFATALFTMGAGVSAFGIKFLAFLFLTFAVGLICVGIYLLVKAIRSRWNRFQQIQDREREDIVSRLKGQR